MLVAYSKAEFGWARSRVVSIRRDGEVVVKLVDLQTLELVTEINRLRHLPAELMEIPSPVIIAKLGLLPADGDLDVDTMEALLEECFLNLQEEPFLHIERNLGVSDDIPVVLGQLVTRDRRPVYKYLAQQKLVEIV